MRNTLWFAAAIALAAMPAAAQAHSATITCPHEGASVRPFQIPETETGGTA